MTLLFVLTLASSISLFAQKQAWNWYFGDHAGISFAGGNATALLNGSLSTGEGCATISDSTGNLLFYTDGRFVYNAQHKQMTNGFGLLGDPSSGQSAIILKKPGSSSLYYLFTIDYNYYSSSNVGKGLNYSIVDMSLNNGLGDVTTKNILIRKWAREKLTAVMHKNGSDFWILINDWIEDNIRAYRLSCFGMDTTAVISNVGPIHNHSRNTYGYMKASKQNNKLALATWDLNSFIVLNFDNNTGIASNRIDIKTNTSKLTGATYGVEFSPDGNLLYGTTIENPKLFQFNLNAGNGTAIANSAVQLASHQTISVSGWSAYYGALQLGPDGRIYSANHGDVSLGVINRPDSLGNACNYVNNSLSLNRRQCALGLPNILTNYVLPMRYDTVLASICLNGSYTLPDKSTVSSAGIYVTHLSSPSICDSIIITKLSVRSYEIYNVSASICQGESFLGYKTTGTYQDTLPASTGCDSIRILTLVVKPKILLTLTKTVCQGESYAGHSITGVYIDTFAASNGCDSIRTLNLVVKPRPSATINQTICQGQAYLEYQLSGKYVDTFPSSSGCDSIRILNLTVRPRLFSVIRQTICEGENYLGRITSGTYIDTLIATNGCDSIRTLELTVVRKPTPYLGSDTSICEENNLVLFPGQFTSYQWQDNSTQSHLTVKQPGIYYVTVKNECGSANAQIRISAVNCTFHVPNAFSPNGDGINDTWMIPLLSSYPNCSVDIFSRYGQLLFHSRGYNKPWNGTYNGLQLPFSTYYWIINLNNGTPKMKGSVTIIR